MHTVIVFETLSSFVRMDIGIISAKYKVRTCSIWSANKLLLPIVWIFSVFRLIVLSLKSKFILVQGGGYHSLISALAGRLTRTPVFIVVIGTDAISLPEIDYGHFANEPLAFATKWSYRLASALFPVHHHLIEQDYQFDNSIVKKQGVRAFVKNLKTPIAAIHNGYDARIWKLDSGKERPAGSFLTVAMNVETSKRFHVKGIDLYLKVADEFPDYQFTLVGSVLDGVRIPANVRLLGAQSSKELINLYSSHRFYIQLSRSEGFPNSLCEAMLCGCFPIVSGVGSQPDIVGECGVVIEKNEMGLIKQKIESAFFKEWNPLAGRERIATLFPLSRRQEQLLSKIDEYLQ